jgi:hypothetical protein
MVNCRLTSDSLAHLPPPSKETQKKPTPGKEKKRLERWREREKKETDRQTVKRQKETL